MVMITRNLLSPTTTISLILLIITTISTTRITLAAPSISLLDVSSKGSLETEAIPNVLSTSKGILTIISSPSTPTTLIDNIDDDQYLTLVTSPSPDKDDTIQLICRGSYLHGTTEIERSSLAFCSLLSDSIIITGIVNNDLDEQYAFRHSRHSRTLTALFRPKLRMLLQNKNEKSDAADQQQRTLLILVVDDDANDKIPALKQEVLALYEAAAAEKQGSPDFDSVYELRILTDASQAVEEALLAAAKIAASKTSSVSSSAIDAFTSTWTTVRDPDFVASILCGLDPPDIAHAFVDVMKSYSKYTKSAFARIAMWKNRIARGLLVDGFGADATLLRQRCLFNGYDIETLGSSGLLHASSYRLELRDQLQSFIDSSIEDCYNKQLINLQESAVKKLQKGLLQNLIIDDTKNTYETNEASMNANAALLRQQSFAVETALDDIQVPILNLTKEKAVRTITSALNDALLRFPDSPAAKIKRTKNVQKIVNKESKNKKKKPGQRSLGFGIDLVAMIRPDGFGSLQGFAGYALPGGNSITVGVHNDADDPQVIAQFGGVRPPLLRVQPKLRIDVEL